MRSKLAAGQRGTGAGALAAVGASERPWGDMTLIDANLRKLSAHEEQVLRCLFGIGELAHSHAALGQRLGISPRSLRQIERQALRHLRRAALSENAVDPQALRARRRPARAVL